MKKTVFILYCSLFCFDALAQETKNIVLEVSKDTTHNKNYNNPARHSSIRTNLSLLPLDIAQFDNAPLSAMITLATPEKHRVKVTVLGQDGEKSNIVQSFPVLSEQHNIPIHGLYPNHNNEVTIALTDQKGKTIESTVLIQTDSLPTNLQNLVFDIAVPDKQANNGEMFLTELTLLNTPIMVDKFGKIRWYSKGFMEQNKFALFRLKNGNMCFGDGAGYRIVEYDMLGNLVKLFHIGPDFQDIHHDMIELPNGNLVLTVNKTGAETVNDHLIEINRNTGKIETVWDLGLILPKRKTYLAKGFFAGRPQTDKDAWFHNNAIAYDPKDNTLVVSGRRQGVVKVSWDNRLKWIFSEPTGWEGYEQFLLKPSGKDFEWSWGQHNVNVLANGNMLLYDNGIGRDYGKNTNHYSRVVEYKINEANKSIEQVWQYGKERGEELYTAMMGAAGADEKRASRIFVAANYSQKVIHFNNEKIERKMENTPIKTKIVEVDAKKNVLFEMNIKTKDNMIPMNTYRALKMNLYP